MKSICKTLAKFSHTILSYVSQSCTRNTRHENSPNIKNRLSIPVYGLIKYSADSLIFDWINIEIGFDFISEFL